MFFTVSGISLVCSVSAIAIVMSCFGIENVGPVSGIETIMSCFGIEIVCLVSGIEIVASAPITIQAVMQNLRSTDSFLVLPTEALGI